MEDTPADYIYAYIAARNAPAMKLASRGYFNSGVVGQLSMNTLFLLNPIKQSLLYTVRRANRGDIDVIVRLLKEEYQKRLLSPAISRDILIQQLKRRPKFRIDNYFIALKEDKPVGVCSAWDMTPIKKNRILAYSAGLTIGRRVYNIAATLAGAAPLPVTGEAFKDVTIADYAVKNRDPIIMEALLRYIGGRYRKKNYHSLIFGSDINDPLLKAASPFLSREIRSNVVLGRLNQTIASGNSLQGLLYADAVQI